MRKSLAIMAAGLIIGVVGAFGSYQVAQASQTVIKDVFCGFNQRLYVEFSTGQGNTTYLAQFIRRDGTRGDTLTFSKSCSAPPCNYTHTFPRFYPRKYLRFAASSDNWVTVNRTRCFY